MGNVECLVNLDTLLVGYLGGSVTKVDISWAVNKKRATSGFVYQVMLGGYLCVSGTCTLNLSCVTRSKLS